MPDFLLEIGVEEIPARMLRDAETILNARLAKLLLDEKLESPTTSTLAYSTPRRLAVVCSNVLPSQLNIEEQLTGPSVSVAYKDGHPTPAAEAWQSPQDEQDFA